jgi:hypothetical protein
VQINLFVYGYDMSSVASQISVNGNTGNFALTSPLPYGRIIWKGMRMAYEAQKKYDAAAYDKVSFRLNKGQPFEVALEAAVIEKGEAKSEYVRNALVRKLAKDGFLPPKE